MNTETTGVTSRYWNQHTRALVPYVPGEQPRERSFIKLNTNENPYPPSPTVEEVLRGTDPATLGLYPDPTCRVVRQAIAAEYGLSIDSVFMGNGSDEVLAIAYQAFFENSSAGGEAILFPDVTYSFYPVYARMYDVPFETPAIGEDFELKIDDYLCNSGGVVLANPNAPTGLSLSVEQIERIVDFDSRRVVIVDEAYADFDDQSAISLISDYPNLLVTRTFSKSYSLAGLRVGFALGHPELIAGLCRVRDSFNSYTVGTIAQTVATAAIRDQAYFKRRRAQIIETREETARFLSDLGCVLTRSKTNFLWLMVPGFGGRQIYDALRKEGILVRHFASPKIDEYVRITIGTAEQMAVLKEKIELLMKDGS